MILCCFENSTRRYNRRELCLCVAYDSRGEIYATTCQQHFNRFRTVVHVFLHIGTMLRGRVNHQTSSCQTHEVLLQTLSA